MLKNVYLPPTILPDKFIYGSKLLRVPLAAYTFLDARLDAGDWAYLRVSNNGATEIVKVIGLIFPDTAVVLRGRDGTDEVSFSAGSVLEYAPTVEAVRDTYVPSLTMAGTGGVEIAGYSIEYPTVEVNTLGASEVLGEINLEIGRREGAYGCCK